MKVGGQKGKKGKNHDAGVITISAAVALKKQTVFNKPRKGSNHAGKLKQNAEFAVVETRPCDAGGAQWLRVETGSGTKGWLRDRKGWVGNHTFTEAVKRGNGQTVDAAAATAVVSASNPMYTEVFEEEAEHVGSPEASASIGNLMLDEVRISE